MPTETEWYLEDRVFISRAVGDITMEELVSMDRVLETYIKQGKAPVHWILDTRKIGKPYLNLGLARKTFAILRSDEFGWAIVCVAQSNRLMSFLATTVGQILGVRYRLVQNLEEAEVFLQERDSSLNFEHVNQKYSHVS